MISIADDDDFLSRDELKAIKKGLEDVKAGRVHRMKPKESLSDFLERTANV